MPPPVRIPKHPPLVLPSPFASTDNLTRRRRFFEAIANPRMPENAFLATPQLLGIHHVCKVSTLGLDKSQLPAIPNWSKCPRIPRRVVKIPDLPEMIHESRIASSINPGLIGWYLKCSQPH
ncbi:hypothetical protein AX14_004385 [Amanita brunnescens Koide BX004]|nr:hypothetical protein AX14_004385 [Amanita brunnescens Koide BX004]